MSNIFADLHCHPVHLNFNESQADGNTQSKTPWDISESKLKKLKKGKRSGYTQADVAKMIEGGVRLVFAALYPMEQGYFMNEQLFKEINPDFDDLDEDNSEVMIDINRSALFVKLTTGFSAKRVRQMRDSSKYNYNNEFVDEKLFWLSGSGRVLSTQHGVVLKPNGNPEHKQISGRYFVLGNDKNEPSQKTISDIKDKLFDEDLVVVFTVEGSHFLTRKNHSVSSGVFSENDILTNVEVLKAEQIPIFFITLNHHFDNTLSAHAHSLPSLPSIIPPFDQSVNMNQMADGRGISDLGIKVIRKLLNIADDGVSKDNNPVGKRILIDVKHMSALTRKEFYEIINAYNQNNADDQIPIIASHVAYSGQKTLNDQIAEATKPNAEPNNSFIDDFLNWNINLCDEDIKQIVKSKGLIGFVFEQRVLGVPFKPLEIFPINKPKYESIEVFRRQIKAMVAAARQENLHIFGANHSVWDTLCIGTDFDGGIDPVQSYPTALHLKFFRSDLKEILLSNDFINCNINTSTIEEVLDNICYKNCHKFLVNHFPK